MPRLKSVTDANGTKIYPVTITRGVYDTDKNQRLNVTLANKAENTVMGASGSTHAPGLVPDTPSTSGTEKYLREDGTWQKPPNDQYESKQASSGGTAVSLVTTGEKYTWNNKQDALVFNSTPSASNKVATMNDVPSSFAYSNVTYNVNSTTASGSIALDGSSYSLYVVALSADTAVTLSANPPVGHSCHAIFTCGSTSYTVTIAHSNTMVTYNNADAQFTVPANGYVEVDFLYAADKIFVRGV